MSSLLNIGTQALTANQSALAYAGQNIANVNTEGYSRQRVNFETQDPPILGVAIQDIQRITDQFLVEQVWRDQSALSSSEQQAKKIELLDKLMVSESTNLSTALDDYFAALQRSVDDPLFIANRQLFLAEAESLVATFRNFDQRLGDQLSALTTESRSIVSSVNAITGNIAQLNVQISTLSSSGQNINTLIDERDRLIKDLSSFISVDVISSNGGITTNVALANGEPLVSSGRAATLSVKDGSPDPSKIEIILERGVVGSDVTNLLGEGSLGGLFTYRDEILQPARNEVGRLALVFSSTMNEQHLKGMDLDGRLGDELFAPITQGQIYGKTTNDTIVTSSSLKFYDVSQLTASEYQVQITGLNTFRVTRLADGKVFDSADLAQPSPIDFENVPSGGASYSTSNYMGIAIDGLRFELNTNSTLKAGDIWLLKPTQDAARQMSLAITNPESLAFASPIRVTAADSNDGNAEVVGIEVLNSESKSLRPGQLNPPVEIVFNALTTDVSGNKIQTFTVFNISSPDNPIPVPGMENLTYQSNQPIKFTDVDGDLYQVTLANQPKPGDRFSITYNTEGYSDNRNALAMADLQRSKTGLGYSYQDAYGQLLAKVGTQANTVQVAYMSNSAVLSASEDALESVRGVNLDEEAAKLIQYQQAYTASTRLITAYQDLFDSLMMAVR